jgi:hypothetical protein
VLFRIAIVFAEQETLEVTQVTLEAWRFGTPP